MVSFKGRFRARLRAAAALAALACVGAAAAAEQRCGWFANPTPANFLLLDADGEWEIGAQGGYQAPGLDALPDMAAKGFRPYVGGPHGESCACLTIEVDRATMRVKRILTGEPRPLAACDRDRRLAKRWPRPPQ